MLRKKQPCRLTTKVYVHQERVQNTALTTTPRNPLTRSQTPKQRIMPKNTRAYRNTLAEFMFFLMGNAAEGDGGGGVAGLVATKDFLYSLGRVSKRDWRKEGSSSVHKGRERTGVHICHRRKVVWNVMGNLIHSGLRAQVACDSICNVYGHGTLGGQHHQVTKG